MGYGSMERSRRRAEREREEKEREGRDRSCLFERETEKEETQAASRKEDLPASVDEGGSGQVLSLKGTAQTITLFT